MASQFLTLEQVCKTLGVTADDVKAMVAEGRLSEVRDAGKIFYREDEVRRMAAKEGSSIVDLAMTEDSGLDAGQPDETESFASALSSLADSSSSGISLLDDTGTGISPILESPSTSRKSASEMPSDLVIGEIPEQLPAARPNKRGGSSSDLSSEIGLLPVDENADKASLASADESPDLGLSGSDVIRLESADDAKKKAKEDTRITSAGISVFDDDEIDIEADPMGKTHVAPAVEDFDAVGSGSGLLDLTRESDDTSLGQILDVISPEAGETEAEAAVHDDVVVAEATRDSGSMASGSGVSEAAFEPAGVAVIRRPTVGMAGAGPVNICLGLGVAAMIMVGLSVAMQVSGVWPALLKPLGTGVVHYSVFGALAAGAIATGIMGILAGRK